MNNYFLEYYEKVKSGEILVGKELRKTLDNLHKDLANPRYFFDLRPGSIRIDFIETFCKHTKSPFSGQPFKLTLWEKAFLQVSYGFKMSDTKLRRFNEVIERKDDIHRRHRFGGVLPFPRCRYRVRFQY